MLTLTYIHIDCIDVISAVIAIMSDEVWSGSLSYKHMEACMPNHSITFYTVTC